MLPSLHSPVGVAGGGWSYIGASSRSTRAAAPRRQARLLMWIVRLALRRTYTFIVMAILFAILGGVTIARIPLDVLPEIEIPVIAVIHNYTGLSPEEMETRIASNFERGVIGTVSDVEHVESQS